jgi:hypothetical protein
MANLQATGELQALIGPGEHVLWAGRPAQGVRLHSVDWLFVPFAVIWFALVVTWEIAVIVTGAPGYFVLIGIPLLLIGIFIVGGRFFWDAKVRAGQTYSLTDRRAIIGNSFPSNWVKSYDLTKLSEIIVAGQPGGAGTVIFKEEGFRVFTGRRNGLGFIAPAQQGDRFDLISDAATVQRLALDARKGAVA